MALDHKARSAGRVSRKAPTQLTHELQTAWRKRLEDAGFEDIEDSRGRLVVYESPYYFTRHLTNFKSGIMEAVRDYYIWAEHMVLLGRFKSGRDRKIWRLHATGKTSRQIERKLAVDQSYICRKIKEIRTYLKAQPAEREIAAPPQIRKEQGSDHAKNRGEGQSTPARATSRRPAPSRRPKEKGL